MSATRLRIALVLGCFFLLHCGPKAKATTDKVTVTPTVGSNGALAFNPAGPYAAGTRVTLTATPAAGYVVDAWSGTDDDTSKSPVNHLTVGTTTKAVGVTFALAVGGPFHLTLPASTPNGTLTASPVEAPAGYAAGTVVTLTATPDAGYVLDAWTGTDDAASTSLTNQVTMSSDQSVGVSFKSSVTVPTYHLTLQAVGSVTLAASSSVPSQSGPNYTEGTVVTLTATLGHAGHKVLWTGSADDSATTTTNTLTIGTAPATVTATSACDTHCTLTVNVDFPFDGHVVVNEVSQNLVVSTGTNATTAVQTLVSKTLTLTAYDTVNWPFQGWASPASSSSTCVGTISMTTDKTVSASFPLITGPGLCP